MRIVVVLDLRISYRDSGVRQSDRAATNVGEVLDRLIVLGLTSHLELISYNGLGEESEILLLESEVSHLGLRLSPHAPHLVDLRLLLRAVILLRIELLEERKKLCSIELSCIGIRKLLTDDGRDILTLDKVKGLSRSDAQTDLARLVVEYHIGDDGAEDLIIELYCLVGVEGLPLCTHLLIHRIDMLLVVLDADLIAIDRECCHLAVSPQGTSPGDQVSEDKSDHAETYCGDKASGFAS